MTEHIQANGHDHHCPLMTEWQQHRARVLSAVGKLEALDDSMGELLTNTRHLSALTDIRDGLLSSAIGKDHVPTKVFLIVLASLGAVILGLMVAIVFLLTGESAGWINALHR